MKTILFILIMAGFCLPQQRPAKMQFNQELRFDENNFVVWHGYMIDSTWLNVWLPDGQLPKRSNGTYLYWKADNNGNLIKRITIGYRFPIFREETAENNNIMLKKKESVFDE